MLVIHKFKIVSQHIEQIRITYYIIFQLYRGCQFYWWRKLEYPQKKVFFCYTSRNYLHDFSNRFDVAF